VGQAGVAARALAARQPIFVSNLAELSADPRASAAQAAGCVSALAVPVFAADEPVGVLEFYAQSEASFTESAISVAIELGTIFSARLAAREPSVHSDTPAVFGLPVAVLAVGPSGIVEFRNPAAARMLEAAARLRGLSGAELSGADISLLFSDFPAWRARLSESPAMVVEARATIGEQVFDVRASAAQNGPSEVSRTVLVLIDATAAVNAERVAAAQQAEHARAAADLRGRAAEILEAVNRATRGDFTAESRVNGTDAIGQIGEGLDSLFAKVRSVMSGFSGASHSLLELLARLEALTGQLERNADTTSTRAEAASSAAGEVDASVQTVAAAADELNVSIREIAKSAADAASVATHAVSVAEDTNRRVERLGDSSQEIGKVIKVINSIAQQTNLLALNATIEAARAGEAGKGFAVVANEVKELAKETAKATEDISQRIEAIQANTRSSVDAIGQIVSIIKQVNDLQATIASAVEEQSATTSEIGRNVQGAARGTSDIVGNIADVATNAYNTTEAVNASKSCVTQLRGTAQSIRGLVEKFRI
jgi:methyl-accepting chemotaxis protein